MEMKEDTQRKIRKAIYLIFALSSFPLVCYSIVFLTPTFTFALWGSIAVFIAIDVIEQWLKKKAKARRTPK